MTKLITYMAIIGGAYWYWSGPYQDNKLSPDEQQIETNATVMQRCIGKEKSMAGVASMGGMGGIADDPQAFCAKEYNLVLKNGEWHDSD